MVWRGSQTARLVAWLTRREFMLSVPGARVFPHRGRHFVWSRDDTAICKTLQVHQGMTSDAEKDQIVLGRALRILRERAGMTQGEVGKRAGTDDTHVSRMESGQFDIRWHTLRRMLAALDATLADLGDAIDQQDPPPKR